MIDLRSSKSKVRTMADELVKISFKMHATGPIATVQTSYSSEEMTALELEKLAADITGKAKILRAATTKHARGQRGHPWDN